MRLQIREALPGDVTALARLLDELGYPASPDVVAKRLGRLTTSEADRCLVALVDGEIAGMATVHASLTIVDDAPVAKLSAIVVDQRHRRRGVGNALLSAIEAHARAGGCSLLFLTTAERRDGAHGFYRRIGFEETGRRFAKRLGSAI